MRSAPRTLVAGIATLYVPAAAGAPALRNEGGLSGGLAPGHAVEYVLGVVTVMLALGVFVYAVRRLQQRQVFGGGGVMRVCASLPLGGKERLLLVEAQGERLLLGVSPGGVQLVRRLAAPPPAPPQAEELTEGNWLSRVLSGEGIR